MTLSLSHARIHKLFFKVYFIYLKDRVQKEGKRERELQSTVQMAFLAGAGPGWSEEARTLSGSPTGMLEPRQLRSHLLFFQVHYQ